MEVKNQKILASRILKCSKKKIKFDENSLDQIKKSITRSDIKLAICKKQITKKDVNEKSRGRARLIKKQKAKKRRSGAGSRKGKKTARTPKKEKWMNHIRSQRALLKDYKERAKITNEVYRDIYRKAKGGFFRSRRHIKLYLIEHKLLINKK